MSLSNYSVNASVAVSDMAEARQFYEAKLGLSEGTDQTDGSRVYACEGGTSLHVYPPPTTSADRATATLATWHVADLEQVVDELTSNGVTFEQFDEPPLKTDDKGIQVIDDSRVG